MRFRKESMEDRDYYEVLDLQSGADHSMILGAYWHLARKYKAAMDQDAVAGQALEELNRSFAVLGNPEARADYDRTHPRRRPMALAVPPATPETKRVSIEVCFWNLPAWQGMVAATCTFALAATALAAGARPLLVLVLAAVTIVAALLVLPEDILRGGRRPIRQRWRREVSASQLVKSTPKIIARWRNTSVEPDMMPLIDLAKGTKSSSPRSR